MEIGGWLGLPSPRPLDALALAFFSDALIPAPFMRLPGPSPAPDDRPHVHFRVAARRCAPAAPDPGELCLARIRTRR